MYKNIFKYDTYVPPLIHFIQKDKFSVHKMGQVFERYNQVEPLVLFDKSKNFKCFQKECDKRRVDGSYFKLPVLDYIEGDSTAAILIQSMPKEFEFVFIPKFADQNNTPLQTKV